MVAAKLSDKLFYFTFIIGKWRMEVELGKFIFVLKKLCRALTEGCTIELWIHAVFRGPHGGRSVEHQQIRFNV